MAWLYCPFTTSRHFQRLLRSSWSVAMMARSSSTVSLPSSNDSEDEVLPFSEMPGPKGTLRNFLNYALTKGSHFEVVKKRFETFGPIYSEQLLSTRIVNISDVDAMTKVLRTETAFQMRPGFEAVAELVEELDPGTGLGLASNDYERWYPDRSLLSPKLLRPKDVNGMLPILNTVANDFVDRMHLLARPDGTTINNIEEELSYWSVESFSAFLFGQRLGFYKHPPDPTSVVFVKSALEMIDRTGKFLHGAPFYKYVKTPAYRALKKSLIQINAAGMDILNKILTEEQQEKGNSEKQNTSLFKYISASGKVTRETMRKLLTGLMTAGIDSTKATCLWLLYELSRHPDAQEKLYQELKSVLGREKEVSATNIQRLQYLKAALKETSRLNPVAGYVLPRVFHNDLDVLGYNIPAGVSIYMYGHLLSVDERYYGQNGKQFVPERWLRDEFGKKQELDSFTSLPFGFGVRMCIGRRMAESLIYSLVSKILLSFRLEYAGKSEVGQILDGTFMKPDRPVLLKLIPR